jgi:hypothetical protein
MNLSSILSTGVAAQREHRSLADQMNDEAFKQMMLRTAG